MNVRVICRQDQLGWILGKIATRLVTELETLVDVSLGTGPDSSADINHYVWYDDYDGRVETATIGITHIDSIRKFELIQSQLESARAGICLSRSHMEDLVHAGIPSHTLCYVNPPHDGIIVRKKIHIGISTRLYPPDPCKREWMLLELAERIDPGDFAFTIMGSDWDAIVHALRSKGFSVAYYAEFNLEKYREIVPTFDYYLYLGWDEGSMGLLDALHAGVKTIATCQGFHLDIHGGLTHPIDDLDSVIAVFSSIAREKNERSHAVHEWTWPNYARKHLDIWEYLLSGPGRIPASRFRDGVNSLVAVLPRDAARGQDFLSELRRIDRMRIEFQHRYDAEQHSQGDDRAAN